jgi:hypothetical protein
MYWSNYSLKVMKRHHSGRLILIYPIRVEVNGSGKPSSLLRYGINSDHKSFTVQGLGIVGPGAYTKNILPQDFCHIVIS